MKPLIGIVARVEYPGNTKKYCFNHIYRERLLGFGADLLGILPPQQIDHTSTKYDEQPDLTDEDKEMIIRQIKMCDGVVLTGGFKTNKFDRFIVDYLIENDIPTLGICLGMQQLSNYGREVFVNEPNDSSVMHRTDDDTCVHDITIEKDTKLYEIIKKEKINVNSRHFYHIVPNELFINSSHTEDGYIESIEMQNKKFIIGVQWHPEDIYDENTDNLFNSFIAACRK